MQWFREEAFSVQDLFNCVWSYLGHHFFKQVTHQALSYIIFLSGLLRYIPLLKEVLYSLLLVITSHIRFEN